MWTIEEMSKIIVESELKNDMLVNLGIGMPTEIPNHIPSGIRVIFQSENGMIGIGPFPHSGYEDADLINAGKQTVTLEKYGSYFDSADSFAMIRGGHVDLTVLGAFQVSQNGDIANWWIPGKMMKGMGGAMDLVASAKKVIVMMDHVSKNGESKVLKKCSLPLTGACVVDKIVTNYCVFDIVSGVLVLKQKHEKIDVDSIRKSTDADFEIDYY